MAPYDFLVPTCSKSSVEPCKLLLGDTHQGDNPRLLFIYKRWIPCIFTIKGLHFYSHRGRPLPSIQSLTCCEASS